MFLLSRSMCSRFAMQNYTLFFLLQNIFVVFLFGGCFFGVVGIFLFFDLVEEYLCGGGWGEVGLFLYSYYWRCEAGAGVLRPGRRIPGGGGFCCGLLM